jgi:putative GTP pyrophosphokinase
MSRQKKSPAFVTTLEREYNSDAGRFDNLCTEIVEQIEQLLKDGRINLASPIESRVKTWASIVEKIQRNEIQPKALSEIRDVAGIRIIALFRRDIPAITAIVESNFQVLNMEDTATRLREDQFGYGSIHYEVQPPNEWLKIPTLKTLHGLRAEIQVRTSSQHIWAAASHVLQYKKVTHVPLPVRRTINRVAALLETVDLEFERVLVEREEYGKEISNLADDIPLNTESLKRLLDTTWPIKNRDDEYGEDYAELLDELTHFKVHTTNGLQRIITKHRSTVVESERAHVTSSIHEIEEGKELIGTSQDRIQRGVYFTHVGLTRVALELEVGHDPFQQYLQKRHEK